ncbi:hypothetical protein [Alkalibacillus almallahensis]|uniref:hypothetical protein n=1 Tax=Alkalibacillus almallahensis TaxID=1379154 RepID=UPI001421D227|nr:hypothetical protein [Alkalibacillus almallahensis]NIK10941.1 hypothetical protein [Alkalibacillus almallahensis]
MSNDRPLAIVLKIIGALSILGSLFIGLDRYEVVVETDIGNTTQKDNTILFMWLAYGFITCILFWAFAEIINYLKESLEVKDNQQRELENLRKMLNEIKQEK